MGTVMVELAGYNIFEQIYQGSRTSVFRGERQGDRQPVILKFLNPEYPSFSELLQFRNQYTLAKNLNIPGIIRPYSLESYRNSYALVMEDCGSISLREYCQTHRLELTDVLVIAWQLTQILHNLHQNRVIHKDIKPANILIHPQSKQIKLIDFSIASLLPKETQEIKNPNGLEGTLAYISPEQTGRMNRGIDYRSDFYSLGVTLFELLTGKLPFLSTDPMELVHCHIAKQPSSVIREEMPPVVVDIVLKLMAKNAEDRYQSSLGLKFDVENCLYQLKETGKIEVWEIGKRDLYDRFLIPEKLYGREREVQTLLDAFERVAHGTSELMLVAGFSGIGKTAVVNEVHKPIVRQHGYFIKGKFDQFNRNIPLSAFVQAFRDLMRQLLSESDAQLAQWKNQILAAVGENGQVLIEVIPELEQIIGKQPIAPELSGSAAQNRFNLLFQKFIAVFTTAQHPLVLFLDDLQWADLSSLQLMKLLINHSGYLLILGAYRDNEVSPVHPLILTVEDLKKAQAIVNTITLAPLAFEDTNRLVADTLNCSTQLAKPLSQLIERKTQGNPFFTTQFLKALHEEKYITFNADFGYWECDIVQVNALSLTDDVVEFMAQQLQKLPPETQQVLKLAACIGNQFDLHTLAIVSEQSLTEAATALWKALQEGLVLPTSQIYKLFQATTESLETETVNPRYRFLHDRVQQAAYSLIPDSDQAMFHQRIGDLFLEHWSEQERQERIFEIVNHLNRTIHLIEQPDRRTQLAYLNFNAGQKAKASTAYQAASSYLAQSVNLLPENHWQQHYDFSLTLYVELASNTCLIGDFAATEHWLNLALDRAESLIDQVPFYEIQIKAHVAQNQLQQAIQLGLRTLQQLEIVLPTQPTPEDFGRELAAIKALLGDRPIADLIYLPTMTDPRLLAAMRVLSSLAAVIVLAAPNLMPFVFSKMVSLSIQQGNTLFSAPGYATYGMILCSVVGEIDQGYAFGQLGLDLLEKLPSLPVKAKTLARFHGGVRHWKENWHSILSDLQVGYQIGLETGDLETTAILAQVYSYNAYFIGIDLFHLSKSLAISNQGIAQLKQPVFLRWNQTYYQHVLNLLGQSSDPCQLIGVAYDETVDLPQQYAMKDDHGIAVAHLFKGIGCYLFDRPEAALTQLEKVAEFHRAIASFVPGNMFYFYDALVRLALYPTLTVEEQKTFLKTVTSHREKIQKLAHHAASNWSHKVDLVEAQLQAIFRNRSAAIDLYDRAITGAKENQYLQEEAIANELTAKFYLEWGKEKVAASYMQEAYYCYAKWGALAKTDDLEQRYPDLLRPILQPAAQTLNPLETLASITDSNFSIHTSTKNSCSPSSNINTTLDFASVLKASQSLLSTIQLDELLHQLTQIILQNSGGDRCALILPNRHGAWQLQAIATPEKIELCSEPLENNPHLPIKLIQYVKNTQELVVIDNLKTDLPVIDEYLMQQQPKSILCLPLLSQGQLRGILYLENPSTAGVFTKDRILILNFLCTQATISLENAQLYQQAQQALQDLQNAQLQIVQSEKMSALGNLVAGVAHEINNPVGCIGGNLQPAQDYIRDLFGLIELYQAKYPEPDDEIDDEIEAIELDYIREDFPKLVGSMKLAVDRIGHISTSLRTFSRTDKDYKVPFNLHEGLDSTLLILKHRIKANEHRPAIEVIKNYGNLPEVQCFPGQLNQVFMNIIANAIDALDESTPGRTFAEIQANPHRITIQTEVRGEGVVVRIADNASGMPEEVKSRIFEQGFTTKSVGKGTGLGLAIARQIVVEKHGGTLLVTSTLGQGTEFAITLNLH
jgi:predicted ATPase/signal transduction histidine kinase